ncbi:MAG: hypothetical protein B6245_23570 [Desulfobacteraceae bacterium 4572_88]|nr:MAG: hypothetical protein B6245_23570 [Desulfobacteraceae bacterium 4572_88]
MSHRPEGIEIQFILYMTACLLLLAFRRECIKSEENRDGTVACRCGESSAALPDSVSHYSCGLVSLSGKKSQKYWKTGIHWLTAVRNLLAEPFTPEISKLIASV